MLPLSEAVIFAEDLGKILK